MYPFERFSENAKAVLTFAQAEAERSRPYIGTEHLVLGLMADGDSIGGKALKELGADEARLRKDIEAARTDRKKGIKQIIPTSRVKRVIEISFEEARRESAVYVGTEHMLLALLVDGDDTGGKLLAAQGVTIDKARAAIDRVRGAGVRERSHERPRGFAAGAVPLDAPLVASLGYPSERFSAAANEAMALAMHESERAHHSYLGTEHFVLGLIQQNGLAGTALKTLGIQIAVVRKTIESVLGRSERIIIQQIVPTSRVRKVIQIAIHDADHDGSPCVTTGHLLVALLTEGEGIAAHILEDLGVTPERAKDEIDGLRQSGMAEPGGGPSTIVYKHRHLEVEDARGRIVRIDLVFPSDYSDEECDAAVARIKDSFRELP